MNSQNNQETAEWRFLYLKTLMDEEPLSVEKLAVLAGLSQSIIVKLRSGKYVKRSTVVKVQDALSKCEKIGPALQMIAAKIIIKHADDVKITRDEVLSAVSGGFVNAA